MAEEHWKTEGCVFAKNVADRDVQCTLDCPFDQCIYAYLDGVHITFLNWLGEAIREARENAKS